MELTAFNSRLGTSQGRLGPNDEDEYRFVLGDNQPGYLHNLEPGDHAEVIQETDLTDIDLVRAELTLSVPDDVPSPMYWEASIIVDGTAYARTTCRPGRFREITDLAANVSKMTGLHQVGVRLALVLA